MITPSLVYFTALMLSVPTDDRSIAHSEYWLTFGVCRNQIKAGGRHNPWTGASHRIL
jgi:hypothetical protein